MWAHTLGEITGALLQITLTTSRHPCAWGLVAQQSFPGPLGKGRERKRGGRGAGASSVWRREQRAGWKGHIHLLQDNGGFAGWLWKDTLRTQCFVTHESFGDLSRVPFSSKKSCQHLKMQRKQPLSFSHALKTDLKYYFRQLLLLVRWKLLQFSEFSIIAVGGETTRKGPSKGSQRWALASSSYSFCSYLGLSSFCFECFLLYVPWAATAQEERNCCPCVKAEK